ncbi:MAG: hypothetical protein ACLFQH_08775 [Halothiobacillaceae bacterium]
MNLHSNHLGSLSTLHDRLLDYYFPGRHDDATREDVIRGALRCGSVVLILTTVNMIMGFQTDNAPLPLYMKIVNVIGTGIGYFGGYQVGKILMD